MSEGKPPAKKLTKNPRIARRGGAEVKGLWWMILWEREGEETAKGLGDSVHGSTKTGRKDKKKK